MNTALSFSFFINAIGINAHRAKHAGFIIATHIYDNIPELIPKILCIVYDCFFYSGRAPQNIRDAIVANPNGAGTLSIIGMHAVSAINHIHIVHTHFYALGKSYTVADIL